MKSFIDYFPDDTTLVRTMTQFSQPPDRNSPCLLFNKREELKVSSLGNFENLKFTSGFFTSTMAAFTALEFSTIPYAVGHSKKKKNTLGKIQEVLHTMP